MSESLRLKKNAGEIYSAPTYWALASQRMRLIVSSRKFRLRGCLLVALLSKTYYLEKTGLSFIFLNQDQRGEEI
jgi:hypothetical protein